MAGLKPQGAAGRLARIRAQLQACFEHCEAQAQFGISVIVLLLFCIKHLATVARSDGISMCVFAASARPTAPWQNLQRQAIRAGSERRLEWPHQERRSGAPVNSQEYLLREGMLALDPAANISMQREMKRTASFAQAIILAFRSTICSDVIMG
jgi:hypothetical protein